LTGGDIGFGVCLPTYTVWSLRSLSEAATVAEEVGFDSVWVSDHFFLPQEATKAVGGNVRTRGLVDAWSTLACLVPVTSRIKLGTCVSNLPLRNPVELARKASTLDHFSQGRVILGVGSGWFRDEFEAFGYEFEPFGIRMAKTIEGIRLMRQIWESKGPATFAGNYYSIGGAELNPKPFRGSIPIWLGGASGPALSAVAELGDGWIPWCPTERAFKEGAARICQRTKAVGRDIESVRFGACFVTYVAETQVEVRRGCDRFLSHRPDFVSGEKRAMFGTPAQLAEDLRNYVGLGMKHIVFELALSGKKTHDMVRLLGEGLIASYGSP